MQRLGEEASRAPIWRTSSSGGCVLTVRAQHLEVTVHAYRAGLSYPGSNWFSKLTELAWIFHFKTSRIQALPRLAFFLGRGGEAGRDFISDFPTMAASALFPSPQSRPWHQGSEGKEPCRPHSKRRGGGWVLDVLGVPGLCAWGCAWQVVFQGRGFLRTKRCPPSGPSRASVRDVLTARNR